MIRCTEVGDSVVDITDTMENVIFKIYKDSHLGVWTDQQDPNCVADDKDSHKNTRGDSYFHEQ
jgi:hypothetical protein